MAAARAALMTAVRNAGAMPVPEIIGAVLSAGAVWAAYAWAGPGPALAIVALLVAAVPGTVNTYAGRREAKVREAEQALRDAEEAAEEAYSLKPAFSRAEERTGKPDAL